jgi:hypothetical protein
MKSCVFSGGSPVSVAVREVLAEDDCTRVFAGATSPVARAVHEVLNPPSEAVRDGNLTARWLREQGGQVRESLVSYLTNKMPRSRDLDVVEDHVQTFLTRMVERDVLAPFLRDGKSVKVSALRIWAYQSATTEIRRWGVDASTRVTRGAKTSREVKAGRAWRVVQATVPAREVIRESEETLPYNKRSRGTSCKDKGVSPDLHDPNDVSPEETADRKSRVDLVRRHLARLGKSDLVAAVDHLLDGGSLSDLPGGVAVQLTAVLRDLRA